jgi:MFS family permease
VFFALDLGKTFSSVRENRALQTYLLSQICRLWAWAALQVAVNWLLYSATRSSEVLAWVNFAYFLPMLIFGLSGGYVADRFNRKKILIITQLIYALLMLVFSFLAAQKANDVWLIASAYFAVGVVFAHDQPVRQALLMNLIPTNQRINAFCCDMIISTLATMSGFASAGLLVKSLGESYCFLFASTAFVVATILLTAVQQYSDQKEDLQKTETEPVKIREALSYLGQNSDARRILFHNSLALLVGTKYGLLFPAITVTVLHANSSIFGYLDAANAIGGALAGLSLANLPLSPSWGGRYAALAGSLLLFILAGSEHLILSIVTVVLLGLCFTLQNNGNYAVLQTLIPDRLRGRIIAIYLIITQLIDQIGNLLAGWGANKYGVGTTLIVEGSLCTSIFLLICLVTRRRDARFQTERS